MRNPIFFVCAMVASFALVAAADAEDYGRGLFLTQKRMCFECHSVTLRNVGPSFEAVAARYRYNPWARDILADKIRHGSEGHWGDRFEMWPQEVVPDDELHVLVDWILQQ
ncbi:MAG: cytochrome C [Betaproteobacteria bacterium]|nr:cytochrome C [Betaproteobacteria bacterium]